VGDSIDKKPISIGKLTTLTLLQRSLKWTTIKTVWVLAVAIACVALVITLKTEVNFFGQQLKQN